MCAFDPTNFFFSAGLRFVPEIMQEIIEGIFLYRPYYYRLWSITEMFHLELGEFSGTLSLWLSPTFSAAFFLKAEPLVMATD